MAEKRQQCEHPNTNPPSVLICVFPEIIAMKRYTKEKTNHSLPFYSICEVYFPCILNLSSLKGSDNVCHLSLRYSRSCNATINAG